MEISALSSKFFSFFAETPLISSKFAITPLSSPIFSKSRRPLKSTPPSSKLLTSNVTAAVEQPEVEVEIAEGFTTTQFCDKIIELFLNEKPKSKDWKKYLVFRDEWKKYSGSFYRRCQTRADAENDAQMKDKLLSLARKVKKIDDEMDRHTDLFKEVQDNPTDINLIVTKRRKDFTGDFFRHLSVLEETSDSLEDRDAIARLGARCLSAVSAYDNTLEIVDTLDVAQAKFNDILNSASVDAACEKVKSLARGKELDSSLILLINSAWASAKESTTMKNEVKDIMYRIYKTAQKSLKSISPKEIKLLKYLMNITDPEERFSALATAFSPGDEHDIKDQSAIYTTPEELHKWIKILLDAYNFHREESEIREAKQLNQPIVIQRLVILKETIEEEYLAKDAKTGKEATPREEL
ncbi:hypothetical protein LIER_05569 [Lithospermum erythrorhizon]|uniref:Uncharacterized protein n=1 Tax=Lithospermum erythrorhizon TaxID=34254 RepID=A0AAV3P5S3_LITER